MISSLGMEPGSRRTLKLSVILFLSLDVIFGWRNVDHIWLAAKIGAIIGLVLETVWREPATRPKVVNVAVWAVTLATVVLGLTGLFRLDTRHLNSLRGQVVPTTLQVCPAQGAQGQTLEVTITGTSLRLTDGSIPHFGTGIEVLDSHHTSQSALAAHIQIMAGTANGFRRVWVSTPGAQTAIDDSTQGAFEVAGGIPAEK